MQDKDNINPNKVLKAIISKENRMKDPFRMKKTVQFCIALSDSEDDAPAHGSVVGEDEEADDGFRCGMCPECGNFWNNRDVDCSCDDRMSD